MSNFHTDHEGSINELSRRIGEWAEGKGFREDWALAEKLDLAAPLVRNAGELMGRRSGVTLSGSALADIMEQSAIALRNNVIGTKLMLIVSEAAEALETLRDHGAAHVVENGNIIEELADIEIRVKDLSHLLQGDLGKTEMEKIQKNTARPHKHGRVI